MKSSWKDEPVVVLDACALIAFFNDEPGADVVAAVLEEVALVEMAAINLLEIAACAFVGPGAVVPAGTMVKACSVVL